MRLQSMPSIDLLRTFEASARHLSFTRAAEELFLTPSAVSRQIKSLEESLGVVLYTRGTRSLQLTEQGHHLQRTVDSLLERLEEAVSSMKHMKAPRQLGIATTISFASMWLVPRLADFRLRHPDVDIRVSAASEAPGLRQHRLDLAIRYAKPGSLPAGAEVLFDEAVFPVCSPRLAGRPIRTPDDLPHHTLLHIDGYSAAFPWYQWSPWLQTAGLLEGHANRALRFNRYDQLIQAAKDGHGVALGRSVLVEQSLKRGELVAPFPADPVPSGSYYLVVDRDAEPHPGLERFRDWLIEQGGASLPARILARRPGAVDQA